MRKRTTSVSHTNLLIWETYRMHLIEDLVDDHESISEDEADIVPLTGVPHAEANDLEDEARRITVRAAQETRVGTTADGMALPFRVPRESDPKIWSVSVKVSNSA
jgi:hypothetical protein